MHDINLPDEVITLATGFGGGMGHTKNTCGAITGAEWHSEQSRAEEIHLSMRK